MPHPPVLSLDDPYRADDVSPVNSETVLGPKLTLLTTPRAPFEQVAVQTVPRSPGWEANFEAAVIPHIDFDEPVHERIAISPGRMFANGGREATHSLEDVLCASGRSRGFEAIKLRQPDLPIFLSEMSGDEEETLPERDWSKQADRPSHSTCSIDDDAIVLSTVECTESSGEENPDDPLFTEYTQTVQLHKDEKPVSALSSLNSKRENDLFVAVAEQLVQNIFFLDDEDEQVSECDVLDEAAMGDAWYFSAYSPDSSTQHGRIPPQLQRHIRHVSEDLLAALEHGNTLKCTAALWELVSLYTRAVQLEGDSTSWSAVSPELITVVVRCLEHEDAAVKRAAFQTLSRIDFKVLADQTDTLRKWLSSDKVHIRLMAFECFAELEPAVLMGCDNGMTHSVSRIISLLLEATILEESEPRSDRVATRDGGTYGVTNALLKGLGSSEIARSVHRVVLCLESQDSRIREAAVQALSRLAPEAVGEHAAALSMRLRDEYAPVRLAALEVFGQLHPSVLVSWVSDIASRLRDVQVPVRLMAAKVLAELEQEDFELYESTFRKQLGGDNTLLHLVAEHCHLQVLQILGARHRRCLLHAQNAIGDTALHVSARKGNLEVCQTLVRLGALTQLPNNEGFTAMQVAEQKNCRLVVNYFNSLLSACLVRVPAGDVLSLALSDERPILGIEWYTVPLPGVAGFAGAVHSLLAITVGVDSNSHDTYVLEKALQLRSEGHTPQPCDNDVYISRWSDVMPNITSKPLHSLGVKNLENNTRQAFCIRTLRMLSVKLGSYNAASCNCHHAAQVVYNACARKKAQVRQLPNEELMMVPWLLNAVGLDFGASALTVAR